MKRTELAKKISFDLNMDFETVIRCIDAEIDTELGVNVDEIPEVLARAITDGFIEERENVYLDEMLDEMIEEFDKINKKDNYM